MPVATILFLLALAGCQNEPEEQRPAACSGTDENAVALITSLRFGREHEDGTAPSFDLDDDVSSMGGSTGCGRPDHVDPEGVEGIDNAFARIVPLLDLGASASNWRVISAISFTVSAINGNLMVKRTIN